MLRPRARDLQSVKRSQQLEETSCIGTFPRAYGAATLGLYNLLATSSSAVSAQSPAHATFALTSWGADGMVPQIAKDRATYELRRKCDDD